MGELQRLLACIQDPDLGARVAVAARELESELANDLRVAVRRRVLDGGLDLPWQGARLRSLWLVSHRALRRGGFRKHPDSLAVAMAWRGEGLVLVRAGGERRSVALVPPDRPAGPPAAHHVELPPDTLYDTLADTVTWHLLFFHSQGAAALRRFEPREEGWAEFSEETQRT